MGNNQDNDGRLITILRRRLMVSPDRATDDQISRATFGTIMLQSARLELAFQDVSKAFYLIGGPVLAILEEALRCMKRVYNHLKW